MLRSISSEPTLPFLLSSEMGQLIHCIDEGGTWMIIAMKKAVMVLVKRGPTHVCRLLNREVKPVFVSHLSEMPVEGQRLYK